MSNQYINFRYDPTKQGYSNTEWHTLFGDAYVSGNSLRLDKSDIIHYGDIWRGDFVFNVNMQTPVIDDNIKFGLIKYSKGAYMYFKLDQGVLTAETSNGVDINSVVIDWDASWSNTDTEFRIKWEAGMVSFFIGGQFKYIISDDTVCNDAMNLYAASDSVNIFLLNYIVAKSVQSFVMSTGNSDSTFEKIVTESDRIAITESVTALMKILIANEGVIAQPLTVTESVTVSTPI